MTIYEDSVVRIKDLIKDKNYDYVEYRIPSKESNKGDFAGAFRVEDGKIISIDGDSYKEEERVYAAEEWFYNKHPALTILVCKD